MSRRKSALLQLLRVFIGLIATLLILFLLRFPILRGLGQYLIQTDNPTMVETIFVLAGKPYDRSLEAEKMWGRGFGENLVCTGEIVPNDFKALGLDYRECDITKKHLEITGVDSTTIDLLPIGTSTLEESDAILNYCLQHNLDSVMVISSMFHTRRIHYFFDDKFEKNSIYLNIHGAPSTTYDEQKWWEYEDGLLMVNNEYVKLLYYLIY